MSKIKPVFKECADAVEQRDCVVLGSAALQVTCNYVVCIV